MASICQYQARRPLGEPVDGMRLQRTRPNHLEKTGKDSLRGLLKSKFGPEIAGPGAASGSTLARAAFG